MDSMAWVRAAGTRIAWPLPAGRTTGLAAATPNGYLYFDTAVCHHARTNLRKDERPGIRTRSADQ